MNSMHAGRTRPLVVLVWSFEIVAAALAEAIEFVDLQMFDAVHGDIVDLLTRLQPDAVVVDEAEAAGAAAAYAAGHGIPVLHVSAQANSIWVFGQDGWVSAGGRDLGAGTIRNVLAGELFGAGVAAS